MRSPRRGQGGMAQGRIVFPRWLHRDQSGQPRQTSRAILQPAGHGGAVDQGGQERRQGGKYGKTKWLTAMLYLRSVENRRGTLSRAEGIVSGASKRLACSVRTDKMRSM